MVTDTITRWVDLSIGIIVFVMSSASLGYLAGVLARRRAWPRHASILMSAAIAFIWPAVIVGVAFYGAVTYQRVNASDPGDAPVYVLMGLILVGGVLFVLSLPLALIGVHVARRKGSDGRNSGGKMPPNTPLQPTAEKRGG